MGRANLLVPRRTRTDAEGRFTLPGSTARSTADLPTCLIVATGPSGDQFLPWTPAGAQPLPVELPLVTLQPRITLSITIDKPELGNNCRVRFASPSVSGRELLRAGEGWQTVFVASPHRPPIRLGVAVVPPDEWSRDVAFLVMNHSKEHRFDLVASGEITGRVVDDEQGLWAARCSLHAWPTPQRAEWTPAPDLARLLAGDAAVGGASAEDGVEEVPPAHWAFLEGCRDWFETESHRPLDLGHTICIDTYAHGGRWLTCLEVSSRWAWQADQSGALVSGRLEELAQER